MEELKMVEDVLVSGEVLEYFKTMVSVDRLRMAGLLAEEALRVDEIAVRLRISAVETSRHLERLSAIGIVAEHERRYRLEPSALENLARRALSGRRSKISEDDLPKDVYDRKVLSDFMQTDGRLKALPSQEKKLLAVLRYLVRLFDMGTRYTEKQVNEILKPVFADTASLRRYLVDYQFMERMSGEYWVKEK